MNEINKELRERFYKIIKEEIQKPQYIQPSTEGMKSIISLLDFDMSKTDYEKLEKLIDCAIVACKDEYTRGYNKGYDKGFHHGYDEGYDTVKDMLYGWPL